MKNLYVIVVQTAGITVQKTFNTMEKKTVKNRIISSWIYNWLTSRILIKSRNQLVTINYINTDTNY